MKVTDKMKNMEDVKECLVLGDLKVPLTKTLTKMKPLRQSIGQAELNGHVIELSLALPGGAVCLEYKGELYEVQLSSIVQAAADIIAPELETDKSAELENTAE